MRLTIISLDSLGDLVLRQPLISALIDEGHDVTLVTQEQNTILIPFLESRIHVITTSIYPYAQPNASTNQRMSILLNNIQEVQPEALVFAQFSRTYLDNWLLQELSNVDSYGFMLADDPGSQILTQPCSIEKNSSEQEKNALLFEKITGKSITGIKPKLTVSQANLDEAYAFLATQQLKPFEYVIGAPMGINNTVIKRWPEQSFIESMLHIKQKHGLDILLTGSRSELPFLNNFSELIGAKGVATRIFSGSPNQFGLFLALLKLSRAYIGTDSGPMHCAAALDVPVVALFGGGTWPRFLPVAVRAVSIAKKLPCYGCHWNCFIKDPLCLTRISAKTIAQGIDWIFSEAADEAKILLEDTSFADLEAVIKLSQKEVEQMQVQHNEACSILSTVCDERLVVIEKQQEEIERLQASNTDA